MSAGAAKSIDARFLLATPTAPGAIALLQLHGSQCRDVLAMLTGVNDWAVGRLRLVRFGDIDEGLAGCLTDRVAQVMPHGGPRVVQRLLMRFRELGVQPLTASQDAADLYPEAADEYEALMLAALSRASSSLATAALLPQAAIWRTVTSISDTDRARSKFLDRLLVPPVVVVAGAANVGKSTLSNALLGRSMSISLDRPGTTRDYTAAHIDLAGLVVQWHDTPGLRETDDPIEARAIELAARLIERADLLIALTDAEHDWPPLPREPDLQVANKADLTRRADADLNVSATTGEGLAELVCRVRDTLVPPEALEAARQRPWLFDARLEKKTNAVGKNLQGFLPGSSGSRRGDRCKRLEGRDQ